MRQPPGYIDATNPKFVCKLHKSLYGLRQAPRAWFSMLSAFLQSHGFVNSLSDSSLFILKTSLHITYILVYVDDILITGSDSHFIAEFIHTLSSSFAMKDLGSLHYFLGIEVQSHDSQLFLSQTKYALDLLAKAGMTSCKPSPSPASLKSSSSSTTPFADVHLYRSLVGSL